MSARDRRLDEIDHQFPRSHSGMKTHLEYGLNVNLVETHF